MPISDVIDLTIHIGSAPITPQGFGVVNLLAPSSSLAPGEVRFYTNAKAIIDDGIGVSTSDDVYKAAQAIFAQGSKPRTVALAGSAAFAKQVVNVSVDVNGDAAVTVTSSGETFNASVSADSTAALTRDLLVAAFATCPFPVTVTPGSGDDLNITSTLDGFGFDVAIGAGNVAELTIAVTTANFGAADAYVAIGSRDLWYGFAYPGANEFDIAALAVAVEGERKMFACTLPITPSGALPSVLAHLQSLQLVRTLALCTDEVGAEYAGEAWLANRLAVNPDQQSTIWTYVTLATVTMSDDTPTTQAAIEGLGGNHYSKMGATGVTYPGQTPSGQKPDIVILADWLYFRLIEAYQRELIAATNRGSKIPYTNDGIAVFESATRARLQLGQRIGHLRSDYTVEMPAIEDVPTADLENRVLRFRFEAPATGAIEGLVITGTVSIDI